MLITCIKCSLLSLSVIHIIMTSPCVSVCPPLADRRMLTVAVTSNDWPMVTLTTLLPQFTVRAHSLSYPQLCSPLVCSGSAQQTMSEDRCWPVPAAGPGQGFSSQLQSSDRVRPGPGRDLAASDSGGPGLRTRGPGLTPTMMMTASIR